MVHPRAHRGHLSPRPCRAQRPWRLVGGQPCGRSRAAGPLRAGEPVVRRPGTAGDRRPGPLRARPVPRPGTLPAATGTYLHAPHPVGACGLRARGATPAAGIAAHRRVDPSARSRRRGPARPLRSPGQSSCERAALDRPDLGRPPRGRHERPRLGRLPRPLPRLPGLRLPRGARPHRSRRRHRPAFRRLDLALACVQAATTAAHRQGLVPTWSAPRSNHASRALAEAAGYRPVRREVVYWAGPALAR
ncbi:GNAT family N-acetyltransferase [Kitasatospora sp. NPDC090091]|uniref:GNAT family N-acetyltransferase n=1 Tax=Kitasatospora sp. NPDC090091 TaxID=3364081 RepID=UPI003809713B